MEAFIAAGIVGATLFYLWRLDLKRQAVLRQELEERLRSRDERLRIIDTELRKARGVLVELVDPVQPATTRQEARLLEALDALHSAGWMASGLYRWPFQPDPP